MVLLPAPLVLLLLFQTATAQLSPSPAYTPPPAESGSPSSSLSAQEQWGNLLGNTLWFYDAQRSGALSENHRVPWRNDSALNDGNDVGLDLSGGFYDAGDYIKATYPLSFVLSSMTWGAIDFGTGYDQSSQTAYLDSTLRWGLDWMIKAHPSPSTLIVQVGSFDIDNNYWGGDLNIATPRPSYAINETAPGTDAAASAAAAFAASSFLYSGSALNTTSAAHNPATLANDTYASTLLQHAKDLYQFAKTSKQQVYQTNVPAVGAAYGSSGFGDNLVWGALWLALATNDSTYYGEALAAYSEYTLANTTQVFNWDSMTPALPVLFAQVALARPSLVTNQTADASVSRWQAECERMFDNILASDGRAQKTRGGLLYYEGDSNEASLNPALNFAMLMLRYAPLATSTDKGNAYVAFAQGQVDYALGKNPMNAPYVVGSNPNSPTRPHSALSSPSSLNDIDSADTINVLYGAVVGGPDKNDNFFNIRSDYPQTEIALDYTAPLCTISAALFLLTPSTPPFYTSLAAGAYEVPKGKPCDSAFPCKKSGLSTGAIIAIVVVVIVVVLGAVLGAGWWKFGWFRGGKRA